MTEDEGPGLHGMHQKLHVVRVRYMGHDSRAGVKDGKDGDEDDQVDVWCFPERRQPSTELRRRLDVESIGDVMRRGRLRWHGHVERKAGADYVKACTRLVVKGKAPVGRPRKTGQNTLSVDMRLLKVDPREVHGRKKWRAIGLCEANTAAYGTSP